MASIAESQLALQGALTEGDAHAEATARNNLAILSLAEGRPEALKLFEAALAALRRAADVRGEAILLINFVPAWLDKGEFGRALELARRAAELTVRATVEHRAAARLQLGRVWWAGFADRGNACAALEDAASVLEDYARRALERCAALCQRLGQPLGEAAKVAAAAGDQPLALRLVALIDPEAATALLDKAPQPLVLDANELLSRRAVEFDAELARWRAARAGALADPETAEAMAATERLFGWTADRAAAAAPSIHRDDAAPTRGGPAALLALAAEASAGRMTTAEALSTARAFELGDDDLAFLIAVPGRRKGYGPGVILGLLELVGQMARDDLMGARCARFVGALFANQGSTARALSNFVHAESRLTSGTDDRLRAEVINEQAVSRLGLGQFDNAARLAVRAHAAALAAGAADLARMALGNQATALLNAGRVDAARIAFEALAVEQRAAGDSAGLAITVANLSIARSALGEVDESSFDTVNFDADRWFAAAHAVATQGDLGLAIERYRDGFNESARHGRYPGEASARSNFARVLYEAHEFEACADQLRKALPLFEAQGHRAEQIDVLLRLASPELTTLTAAVAAAEQAVRVARDSDDVKTLGDALGTLGQLQVAQRSIGPALATLDEAVRLDPRPQLQQVLASAQVAAGQAEKALPVLAGGVEQARAPGGDTLLFALARHAEALAALGRGDEQLRSLREAGNMAIAMAPSAAVAGAFGALGWALVESGTIGEGIEVLEQALAQAREAAAANVELVVLANLGMAYNEIGEYDGATAVFEAARDRARKRGDSLGEGPALIGLANVANSRHERARASALYREAAGIGRECADARLEAAALDSLAMLHVARGETAGAIDLQRRAAQLHHAIGSWRDEATDRINLATSYLQLSELEAAGRELDSAQALVAEHRLSSLEPALTSVRAQWLARQGTWDRARGAHAQALALFEAERAQGVTPSDQRRRATRHQSAYGLALEDALRAGDARTAVEFLEAARTRYFEAVLAQRERHGVPEVVMRRWESALDRVDDLQRKSRARSLAADAGLRRELARALAGRDALRSLIDGTVGPGSALVPAAGSQDFDTFVRAVPRGHAAVYLTLTNRGTAVTCAGRDMAGLAWSAGAIEPDFTRANLVALLYGDGGHEGYLAAMGGDEPAMQRALELCRRTLGERVWPMIEHVVSARTRRLILLPGAGFSALPWHAAPLADGLPVQESFELRYAPSLQLLAHASKGPPLSGQPALGQAIDPGGDLPYARAEAVLVAARLAGSAHSAVSGGEATPDAVQALFARAELVHFGGHGRFDAQEPMHSRLACAEDPLTPGATLSVRRLLEAGAVMRCRLALLSACESGRVDLGDELDDAIGLPATLLASGCRGVLAAAWPVDDLAACLMTDESVARWRAGADSWPAAVAQAASWLRRTDRVALRSRVDSWREVGVDAAIITSAQQALAGGAESATAPFADVLHWGALHVTGLPDVAVD